MLQFGKRKGGTAGAAAATSADSKDLQGVPAGPQPVTAFVTAAGGNGDGKLKDVGAGRGDDSSSSLGDSVASLDKAGKPVRALIPISTLSRISRDWVCKNCYYWNWEYEGKIVVMIHLKDKDVTWAQSKIHLIALPKIISCTAFGQCDTCCVQKDNLLPCELRVKPRQCLGVGR
jgi:hypothetical protein